MMIRMVANKNGQKNDTLVRTYNRQQGNQKITKAQSYTRLFSVIVFENNQPTSRLAYIMEDQMNHHVGRIGVDLGAILEDTLNNNNFSHAHHLNKILEDKIKEEEAITIKNIILVFEIHEINVYFATSKIYILPRRLYSRHS